MSLYFSMIHNLQGYCFSMGFSLFLGHDFCACLFVCRACLAARVTLTNRPPLLLSLSTNRFDERSSSNEYSIFIFD